MHCDAACDAFIHSICETWWLVLTPTNLRLLVTALRVISWSACRSTLTAILIQDVVIMVGTPSASLLLAYLRRLARDPSVLHLEPEDIKPTAQGRLKHMPKGKVCQGCEECNSPVWLFKVRNGAALWAQACEKIVRNHHPVMPYLLSETKFST